MGEKANTFFQYLIRILGPGMVEKWRNKIDIQDGFADIHNDGKDYGFSFDDPKDGARKMAKFLRVKLIKAG
ncbi:MAG: hypothetical protein AAB486_02820 [Patescibacteria group bacterium]